MTKDLTSIQREELDSAFEKARKALAIFETYDQERVDKLCQAVAAAISNKKQFTELSIMGVKESGLGNDAGRPGKRFKIHGILRDSLRQKSVGLISVDEAKGISKYAKPVGIIASVVPTTNPVLTPAGTAIYAIKARDAVIFSPHPRSKKTAFEAVEIMREALVKEGAPEDIIQCIQNVNMTMTQTLMAESDLVIATGGQGLVKSAYSSGTPAYGVGAGNSTMIIDETADIKEAAHNTMLSKTSDFGSGCSADGNLIIEETIYSEFLDELQEVGGYFANDTEKDLLKKVIWDSEGHRLSDTVAVSPQTLAKIAGFEVPENCKFIFVEGDGIGREHFYSLEKLTTLLATYKYKGFDNALVMMHSIYNTMGKGHSCGIYSFNDDHIDALASVAPVSRIMVRQPQSKANAGSFTNGMPMTSSLGCGTWGGNIISENVNLKHYMNVTWVSRPIPEDRPTLAELFGEYYDEKLEI